LPQYTVTQIAIFQALSPIYTLADKQLHLAVFFFAFAARHLGNPVWYTVAIHVFLINGFGPFALITSIEIFEHIADVPRDLSGSDGQT